MAEEQVKSKSKEVLPKEEKKTDNIFSGLNSTNLFNNTGVNVPSIFSGSTLFGNPTTGLFANTGPSLFDQTKLDLTKPASGSLFGLTFQAPKSDESEGEDDKENPEDDKSDDEPKEVIMKYEYDANTEQILKLSLEKFRKNNNDVLEKGTVAIEKVKDKDSYFFVYRNSIQQPMYQGQLVTKISTTSALGQKPENLLLKAVTRKDEHSKFTVDTLKLMFTNKEGAEEFKTQLQKILKKDN